MAIEATPATAERTPPHARSGRRSQVIAAVALVAVLLGVSAFMAWEVPRISPIRGTRTDLIMELVALRALAHGQDPYSPAVSAQIESAIEGRTLTPSTPGYDKNPFLYPLAPALLLLPITPLSTDDAVMLMRMVTVALYLAALALLIWRFAGGLPLVARAGLLLVGIAWWPFLAVILPIVQQAGTVFALLVFALLAAERGRWFWSGAAAYAALLKPADSGLVVLLLVAWALTSRAGRWRFVWGFLALALPTAALAFVARPTWLFEWITQLLAWRGPGDFALINPPATVAHALGLPAGVAWGAVALIVAGWAFAAWRAIRSRDSATARDAGVLWWHAGIGCILIMLIPRVANYDMVVLLIPWFIALRAAGALAPPTRAATYAALAALLVGVGLLAYRDHALLEMPIFALALLVALWLPRPTGHAGPHASEQRATMPTPLAPAAP